MRNAVVISVHDIAPSTLSGVRWLLGALDGIGARPRVLKVVPNEDGAGDIRECPELVRLLHEQVASGSEVVLHGYTHRAAGPLRGPWPERIRARLFAGSAAEFLTLDEASLSRRLIAGQEILASVGLHPQGFCAPAWLAPPELPRLLRSFGFRYLAGMATLTDIAAGRRLYLPWLGYMGSDAAQERLVGLAGRMMLRASAPFPAIKVFLHPQQVGESAACRQTLRTLAALLQDRRPVTYAELLAA